MNSPSNKISHYNEYEKLWADTNTMFHCSGDVTVVGVKISNDEVFRSVWKYFKRCQNQMAQYVRYIDQIMQNESSESYSKNEKDEKNSNFFRNYYPEKWKDKIPCLDFYHLDRSPSNLVKIIKYKSLESNKDKKSSLNFHKAFFIHERPGFMFIPNPFKTAEIEAMWAYKLANEVINSSISKTNLKKNGEECVGMDPGLRWATLGFHYNWKKRKYSLSDRNTFPSDLFELSQDIINSVNYGSLIPETAIINFYKKGSTMGGHKDDAEWTDKAPVVSISFGNAGIYILGGSSQTDNQPIPPVPLIVRSGDIVILGKESRMNIHGVPCFLKNTLPNRLKKAILENNLPKFATYMHKTRININVRQVMDHVKRMK